jgi:hypothetical protein
LSAIPHSTEPNDGPGHPGAPGGGEGRRLPPTSGQEFRPYRRFVYLLALSLIVVGVFYLLISVGTSIYRQRRPLPSGLPVNSPGAPMTRGQLVSCWQGLSDVTESLAKHLEKSHYLLGGYDQEEAQRWANEGVYWRNQWRALGTRCRLDKPAVTDGGGKALDEMAGAYRDLGETYVVYTQQLQTFVREQAPRLDRVRKRINRIGRRLENQ